MRKLKELHQEELEGLIHYVCELREKGLSYSSITSTIAKEKDIKVSKATVLRWCKGLHSPFNKTKALNLHPSSALAYIIGVYFGDGSILATGYKYRFRLKAIDKEFVEKSAEYLRKIGANPTRGYEENKSRSDRWYVEVASKSLYKFLKQPKEKLFDVAREYPEEFLKGFFDSEGTISWNRKHQSLFISASNYDLEVLELCRELLGTIGIYSKIYLSKKAGTPVKIRGEKYQYRQNFYEIRIYRRDSIVKFYSQIGFTITRKQEKLKSILQELGKI
ncbi:hypothetical protein PAP_03710 [Palaeococcus pacificus DY20341]|uniref:DOD-type homing endonuclease domain-containing protein n=1 Tax=Palaeococcus pacificus DY20341 TaxID=1343739 RepID=A0A075LST7_9EURY|nr:LAGLIDADG family homing endonuclease [Palaeococcus pacificus]AIF69161.1 hypothetical protein PAP_03710 [Palaeococcus pacificus DY20341]